MGWMNAVPFTVWGRRKAWSERPADYKPTRRVSRPCTDVSRDPQMGATRQEAGRAQWTSARRLPGFLNSLGRPARSLRGLWAVLLFRPDHGRLGSFTVRAVHRGACARRTAIIGRHYGPCAWLPAFPGVQRHFGAAPMGWGTWVSGRLPGRQPHRHDLQTTSHSLLVLYTLIVLRLWSVGRSQSPRHLLRRRPGHGTHPAGPRYTAAGATIGAAPPRRGPVARLNANNVTMKAEGQAAISARPRLAKAPGTGLGRPRARTGRAR